MRTVGCLLCTPAFTNSHAANRLCLIFSPICFSRMLTRRLRVQNSPNYSEMPWDETAAINIGNHVSATNVFLEPPFPGTRRTLLNPWELGPGLLLLRSNQCGSLPHSVVFRISARQMQTPRDQSVQIAASQSKFQTKSQSNHKSTQNRFKPTGQHTTRSYTATEVDADDRSQYR